MTNKINTNNKGQSLFEVIVAVGIASLILMGVVILGANSVRNTTYTKNNAQASKYAQDGYEWIREQRDTSWLNLSGHIGTFNLGTLSWASATCTITNTNLCRQATLTVVNPDMIDVLITVSWTDSEGTHVVRNPARFSNWNK